MDKYYTYTYSHPNTKVVRYVGKGTKNRAWSHLKSSSNKRLSGWIRNLADEGLSPVVEIVTQGDEEWALFVEEEMIRKYGRLDLSTGTLFNLTDGGEGSGSNQSLETRLKRSNSLKSRVISDEERARMSARQKGKVMSQEARNKLSESITGRKLSEEHRRKISEGNKGKVMSEQARLNISNGQKGKVMSAEAKSNTSKGLRRYWANKRAAAA